MKEAIAAFWRDFQVQKSNLETLETANDPAYDQVLASLQRLDPHLYFEFCSTPGINEFIITAEGKKRLFPLVEEIVGIAPDIPDWKIVALKPKRGFPVTARWEQTEIEINEVLVAPVFRENGEMGLKLYAPNLTKSNKGDIHNALLRALDSGLGEKRFAESIAATWVYPVADAPRHAFQLVQLDTYIGRRNNEG